MTDIQDLMDAMSDAAQGERTKYHVTLGELLAELEDADDDTHVEFSDGAAPVEPHSYRGYYQDLAFDGGSYPVTVAAFRETVEHALGRDFTGYKGGQYTMGPQTPLWRAEWGYTGSPVLSIEQAGDTLVLVMGDEP